MIDNHLAKATEFLVTKEYRKFEEFCNACSRERYIGICYGTPGVGKTLSARYFANQDLIDEFSWENIFKETPTQSSEQIASCRTLLYTVEVRNTPKLIEQNLDQELREHRSLVVRVNRKIFNKDLDYDDRHDLIILDEADRLKANTLEQVRDIYDRKGIGIVLVGMPGMEKRLARYPQLYSRVGFAHEFRPIGKKEIHFVLEHYWKQLNLSFDKENTDCLEAISAIVRITNGNFRLITRMFSQIKRILEINKLQIITKEVIEAARDCLVIGSS